MYSTPEIVSKIVESEEEGYNGVFVSCASDPAISVARELVDIPIVGGFEPAALSVGMISKRWRVFTSNWLVLHTFSYMILVIIII
ncbi:hypothetical protein [Photorhabdus stackebrandtii]|uniref:Hydantoin racemase n=1 Tax=Photorhabdus stackebrandtii TaxID=1123042 RepID=A0A7X5TK85_9GAMM|nr:hypothetical protein [Photorhabdus stackebrandtii]NHB95074.1 hypothetical protein [Photorhabdus stackebrandtii]